MGRCRCTDIKNANSDLSKLKTTRDYLGEASQISWLQINDALDQLAGNVQKGATPNNIFVFQSIRSKIGQPVYEALKKSADKCVNNNPAYPGGPQFAPCAVTDEVFLCSL
jgi:hypothetical protein